MIDKHCLYLGDDVLLFVLLFVGKRDSSAKVFSVLSRSWYSKSTQFTKDATEFSGPNEPCKPGAHCATLKKLYAAEKELFKAVKVRQ